MTAIFSTTISSLPTIIQQNGTITDTSYNTYAVLSGNNAVFAWTPTTTGIFNFLFNSVTGASSLLSSGAVIVGTSTLITPLPTYWTYPATVSASNVTATTTLNSSYYPYFTMSSTLSLTGTYANMQWLSNGVTSNQKFVILFDTPFVASYIIMNNSIYTGNYAYTGIQNFCVYGSNNSIAFTNVGNYSDETSLTFIGSFVARQHVLQDIVDQQIFFLNNSNIYQYYVLKISNGYGTNSGNMGIRRLQFHQTLPPIAVSIGTVVYFYFSDPLSSLPTITQPNGTVSSASYVGNYITFTWTPSSTGTNLQFQFSGISTVANNGTLTSGYITVVPQTTLVSLLPNFVVNSVAITMAALFSNSFTFVPTVTPPNGTVTNISNNGSYVFFTWTPSSTGSVTFSFTNVFGASGTLTSASITVGSNTVLVSLTPTSVTNGILTTMTAVFSASLSVLPTITPPNGTVSNSTYFTYTVLFSWTPLLQVRLHFNLVVLRELQVH